MNLTAAEQAQFEALLIIWRKDIAAFALDNCGIQLTAKQIEFCNAFRDNRQITFRGGVGFGKTMAMSIIVLWALMTHDEVQVTIFGPTEGQLKGGVWNEIESLFGKLDPMLAGLFDFTATRLSRKQTPADCFAEFRLASKDKIANTRGIHKTNNFVLVDEATGVDEEIFTGSLINILTDPNPKLCLVSNPDKIDSYFYRTFYDPGICDDWVKVHGAMIDGRNATPELIESMAGQYGGKTTNRYRYLVLGEFPLSDVNGLIPREAVEQAINNADAIPAASDPIIWGVDPAGAGNDRSVLIKRQGNKVLGNPNEWRKLDPVQLAHKIFDMYQGLPSAQKPKAICVDGIGVGAGTFAALRDFGLPARSIIANNNPTRHPDQYHRLRDQLWWECRQWFLDGNVSIPDNADLIRELCTPTFEEDSGKIVVESKKAMRKRIHVSPDYADALCLTFAINASQISGRWAWKKPMGSQDLRRFE